MGGYGVVFLGGDGIPFQLGYCLFLTVADRYALTKLSVRAYDTNDCLSEQANYLSALIRLQQFSHQPEINHLVGNCDRPQMSHFFRHVFGI